MTADQILIGTTMMSPSGSACQFLPGMALALDHRTQHTSQHAGAAGAPTPATLAIAPPLLHYCGLLRATASAGGEARPEDFGGLMVKTSRNGEHDAADIECDRRSLLATAS